MRELSNQNLETFKTKMMKYKKTKGPLIPILHEAQEIFGYIPLEAQQMIEEEYGIPNAFINGVISFYEMFYHEPTGEYHIGVCSGTSCHINRSKRILEELKKELGIEVHETTNDGLFTIVNVKCIGRCSEGPNLTVNNKVYSQVTVEDVSHIISEFKKS
ncbi:MAG: NAD(P)H-dependent oxidoreductase subunit E [Bacilli bacterium]|nr:NAD(P)H-dependent oxidoreductase subunit E [Bacilli bacterium]